MRDVVEDLYTLAPRGACTDAERRAALWLHDELRGRGHEAWMESVWVRPQWPWSLALHSVIGIAASLVSTAEALVVPALVAASLAFVSWLVELAGRPLLPFYRRATQLVVVEPAVSRPVTLWITANVDAPRRGFVFRDGIRRWGARLRPGVLGWIGIALAGVVAACVARVVGAEGSVLGGLQFVPTLVLLLAATAAFDIALSEVSPGAGDNASGVAAAVALYE
jgi:hypothetical protein